MVLTCMHCGSSVGEESCVGCMQATPYYLCSRCHKQVPNPKFRSEVQCPKCGGYIYEEPHKSERHTTKLYVCQHCKAVVENPKFTNYHPCENCKPPTCKCGGLLATNALLDFFKCVKCGKTTSKLT